MSDTPSDTPELTFSLVDAAEYGGVSKPTIRTRLKKAGYDLEQWRGVGSGRPGAAGFAIPISALRAAGITPADRVERVEPVEVESVVQVKLEGALAVAAERLARIEQLQREQDRLAGEVERLGGLVTWLQMQLDREQAQRALPSGERRSWLRRG
jgi:hypothetical protein